MLYTTNLQDLVFHRHEMHDVDELIVLSGYLGPKPVADLKNLPLRSSVIYGMYGSEGIKKGLHNSLNTIQKATPNLNIYYSLLPVHSKCYVWRNDGKIVHALIGSANFSINGLTTPFREILAETTFDTFKPLNDYIKKVIDNSISCLANNVGEIDEGKIVDEVCKLPLVMRGNVVHNASGLNWGYTKSGKPSPKRGIDDACIPIPIEKIKEYPHLFPPKLKNRSLSDTRGRKQRSNEAIEIIWDDGITMEGLLEGDNVINGVKYPKQISSFPIKAQMGEYFRNRLGVPLGQPVRTSDLKRYGRYDVEITLLAEGVYKFDFSV